MRQHVGQERQFQKMEGTKKVLLFLQKFENYFDEFIREFVRTNYDKPLSLRLQWILKEMREKSHTIGNIRQATTGLE
jgi:hypothetical protein